MPLRQHPSDESPAANLFTAAGSGIPNELGSPQAENRALNQAQMGVVTSQGQSMVFSPLPPSSPMVETQLQLNISSSPMTQLSPASSFLPSSPSKPLRTWATQRDPLFGCVKGATKGSQPWSKLTFFIYWKL
ncbi:hypothetical protein GYMLUDRAFT_63640 [Collybiopsis luxurians FD-317 M1]|uniref:Uncharacterized protein n=1 Tax=Collybiopsis luxurians FD-317 M1 TaxID=944289 RepID=A0A0D0AT39_9AGAR|nr:hypothetical protein GYMLUDRAFT_63640 [Collybiopsis luxurians FD-317 M1]